MNEPTPAESETIEAFQAQRRSFQKEWNRTFLFLLLPGFLLFAAGGYLGMRTDGWLRMLPVAPGFLLVAGAVFRGGLLMRELRLCPGCGQVQGLEIRHPFRRCAGCGVRLSYGAKDSS